MVKCKQTVHANRNDEWNMVNNYCMSSHTMDLRVQRVFTVIQAYKIND